MQLIQVEGSVLIITTMFIQLLKINLHQLITIMLLDNILK